MSQPYFYVRKTVHWSDCDAAGVAYFPNFLAWFEAAEEELYVAVLGRTRQSLLDAIGFAMPRVEAATRYRAPVRPGDVIRIGIVSTLENPRRVRHAFEMRHEATGTLAAEGFVRVACTSMPGFTPRDLPDEVRRMIDGLPALAAHQARGGIAAPWV